MKINGWLFDKPEEYLQESSGFNFTSINEKVGHAGTLDPMAGLIAIAIGEATDIGAIQKFKNITNSS